ncbi:hypothetical protein [Winogradskyella sp. A3E31]|uniref:hypothetical protein n=1 Tax=Winogradskyella sp. A3E31 TaxID=3349637 RepID=UPI00398B850F
MNERILISLQQLNIRNIKITVCVFFSLSLLSCPSDDDCTKTITIPQVYFVGNQSYTNEITQEVPCNFEESDVPDIIEAPVLENFTYEILSFNFVPDTGNNTSILQFEIQLNNNNDFNATGIPKLTVVTPNSEFSGSFSNYASVPCYEIPASSNCILTYDQESSLDLGLPPETFEIVNVEYVLTN